MSTYSVGLGRPIRDHLGGLEHAVAGGRAVCGCGRRHVCTVHWLEWHALVAAEKDEWTKLGQLGLCSAVHPPPPQISEPAEHRVLARPSRNSEHVILSDFLGYASIGSWLGAQFPQVLENVRRQSCDGLALPFLLNWLMGDATNLLGCILTHQLPFQTWLATYFCCVDCALLCQYIYYSRKAKLSPPYLHARSRTTSTATRRMSMERGPTHYRALSNVAANVAAAAALAAQQEEHSRWQRHSYEGLPRSAVDPYVVEPADDDEVDDEALARLADSFQSEGGRSARRKKVSWSQERRPPSLTGSRQSTMSPTGRMHASLHMTPQPSRRESSTRLPRAVAR
ncbi:PQ loop repeat-domain-containing protein [Amylocystis lapponica]|nr:PQ loop repeat-domain-containing protein [Amylocystis lapponica]